MPSKRRWIIFTCSGILYLVKSEEAMMPKERLSTHAPHCVRCSAGVHKIHEVLRLKWECGLSNRAVAHSCSISHSTVREYLRRAEEVGLSWPLPKSLGENELFRLLFPKCSRSSSRVIPLPDWPQVHTELRRKSVTLRLLWVDLRSRSPPRRLRIQPVL